MLVAGDRPPQRKKAARETLSASAGQRLPGFNHGPVIRYRRSIQDSTEFSEIHETDGKPAWEVNALTSDPVLPAMKHKFFADKHKHSCSCKVERRCVGHYD
jgi:hypothetical protein